jgi:hypothetical protein
MGFLFVKPEVYPRLSSDEDTLAFGYVLDAIINTQDIR